MISMHSTSRYTLLEEDISDDKIDDHNAISFVAVLNMLSSFFKNLRGAIGAKRVKCYMRTAKLSVKATSQ